MTSCCNKRKLFTIRDECRLNTQDCLPCKHQYYPWNFECRVIFIFETLLAETLFWLKTVHLPLIKRNIWECRTRLIFTWEPTLTEKISKLHGYRGSSVVYVLSKAAQLSIKEFTRSKRKTGQYSHNLTSLHTHQINETLSHLLLSCGQREHENYHCRHTWELLP